MEEDRLVPRAEIAISMDADALPAPIRDALAPGDAEPPVPAQRASHTNRAKLESEKIVIAAPLSYAGSAARIWKLTGAAPNVWARIGIGVGAVFAITIAWCFVTVWYVVFGLLLWPYRLIRRGQRKRKRENLQHRELLGAMRPHDE